MSRYVLRDSVLRAEVKGEEVLLDPDRGMYHLVNATGLSVLQGMAEGGDLDTVVAEIARRTGEPLERVRADAQTFIDELMENGLIEEAA